MQDELKYPEVIDAKLSEFDQMLERQMRAGDVAIKPGGQAAQPASQRTLTAAAR